MYVIRVLSLCTGCAHVYVLLLIVTDCQVARCCCCGYILVYICFFRSFLCQLLLIARHGLSICLFFGSRFTYEQFL